MTLTFQNTELSNILDDINRNLKIDCDNICSICRDPLLLDTIVLNCKHRFHSNCIKESFIKYESKKCPLCSDLILWDSYKTKCMITKKNGEICNKICYNDEKMCNLHIKTHLKMIEKEKSKSDYNKSKVEKNILNKIKTKSNQIKKLKEKISILESEIMVLKNSI